MGVELFCPDATGGRDAVTFEDAYGGAFPFGAIWVAAYDDATATTRYFGTDTILAPTIADDTWSMTVDMPAAGDLRLYATLDRDNDRILASGEPIGVYPEAIAVTDGSSHTDIPIVIVTGTDEQCASGGGSGGSGTGGSGSGGSGTGGSGTGGTGGGTGGSGSGGSGGSGTGGGDGSMITISGPVTLDSSYSSGDGAAMLLDADGAGPAFSGIFTPSNSTGSWLADHSFEAEAGFGGGQLVGVIDSTGNSLFDATDTWGAYVRTTGVDANPISVGTTDLTDMEIEIPLSTGTGESPLSVVPYTTISGTVEMNDRSTFDTLAAGSTIYVTALQYRPNTGIAVSALLADSYDIEEYAWPDLTGNTSVAYSLVVPANTVVYLWAYVDEDVDGFVNEEGEAVASGSSEPNGRLSVGTADITEDFALAYLIE